MSIYLKQSTASQEIPLGYFVDSTDGNTEETALTIANTDIKLWKAGATTLANKNSGGGTHISNGIYYAVLDATDTDTLGSMIVFVHVSGALPVRVECVVLAANVYDSLIGGGDLLQVDATQFAGTAYATALAAEVDAVWDEQVDGTTTARQSVRLQNSAMGGKASGLGTTTAVYRDLADSKDRISATVDADGNRTAVTRDLT
jgi:hypothetical protein